IIVVIFDVAAVSALLGSQGGLLETIYLPTYDLIAGIPVALAATVMHRNFIWPAAALSLVCIIGDFALQPHGPNLSGLVATYGPSALVSRPIAFCVILATVAYLGARSIQQAIERADLSKVQEQVQTYISGQRAELAHQQDALLAETFNALKGWNYGEREFLRI